VSAARNVGITEARGDWVAFLDDDDVWAPDKLAKQLHSGRDSGASWSYTGFVQVDEHLAVWSGERPVPAETAERMMARKNMLPAGASVVMARRQLLLDLDGFDETLFMLEDWDLWIRLAATSRPVCVPEPLAAYVEHVGMASYDTSKVLRELRQIEARYAALRRGQPVDSISVYRWMGWCSMRAGRRLDACKAFGRAVAAGDISSVARAVVALSSPRLAAWVVGRRTDKGWAAGSQGWLHAFQAG
jgi:glycosyltransferase involved in cell wall biosynthesis